MEHGVYIVDLEMKAVPRLPKSRLHPITIKAEKYPVILDERGVIVDSCKRRVSKSLMKSKSVNYDSYVVTLKYTNPKFSTKIYGT